jgi:outer membrane PBP1 activator LpoA protein
MTKVALILMAALALAGCSTERNTDVKGFTQEAKTPDETAILRSIATYRTTKDQAAGCRLVTQKLLDERFEGEARNCEQVLRDAPRHLPDTAKVESVSGDEARVLVDEPTATKSVYEMRREGGTWKVDAIIEAK